MCFLFPGLARSDMSLELLLFYISSRHEKKILMTGSNLFCWYEMKKLLPRRTLWFDIVKVTLITLAFLLKIVFEYRRKNTFGTQDRTALEGIATFFLLKMCIFKQTSLYPKSFTELCGKSLLRGLHSSLVKRKKNVWKRLI